MPNKNLKIPIKKFCRVKTIKQDYLFNSNNYLKYTSKKNILYHITSMYYASVGLKLRDPPNTPEILDNNAVVYVKIVELHKNCYEYIIQN